MFHRNIAEACEFVYASGDAIFTDANCASGDAG